MESSHLNLDEFGRDIRDTRRRTKVEVKPKPKPKEKPKIPAEIEALPREREEIRALLASLEEYHRKGSLSESTYRDLKATNKEKLRKIEEAIRTGR
jgi:transposase